MTLGRSTIEVYHQQRQSFLSAYQRQESDQRRAHSSSGNFYFTKARDLGKGCVRAVDHARRSELIDRFTAAAMMDTKVGQIDRLAKVARLP